MTILRRERQGDGRGPCPSADRDYTDPRDSSFFFLLNVTGFSGCGAFWTICATTSMPAYLPVTRRFASNAAFAEDPPKHWQDQSMS